MHALRECFQSSVSILNIVNAIDLYKLKPEFTFVEKNPSLLIHTVQKNKIIVELEILILTI